MDQISSTKTNFLFALYTVLMVLGGALSVVVSYRPLPVVETTHRVPGEMSVLREVPASAESTPTLLESSRTQ